MAEVLVVDDDHDARIIMSMTCRTLGLKTREAKDGVEALQAVRRKLPQLIILDLSMPRMDGREFLQEIHADDNIPDDIPVLVFTAHSLTPEQAQDLRVPDGHVIPKAGRNVEQLRAIIRDVLHM